MYLSWLRTWVLVFALAACGGFSAFDARAANPISEKRLAQEIAERIERVPEFFLFGMKRRSLE